MAVLPSAPAPRLLQLIADAGSEPAWFASEVAEELGGVVFSVMPTPGVRLRTAWRQALDRVQPTAVLVQHLGAANPDLLLDLRERGIPYGVFLHDFTALCPTQHLWHRRQEPCSGPGRTGAKCAWCVSGTRRRVAEWPLRTLRYRHRPRDWRTALVRAEVLVASSRYLREFWVELGAPPERVAVLPPWLGTGMPPPPAPRTPLPRLFYAGGGSIAAGGELLLEALDLLRRPVHLVAAVGGGVDATQQARLRTALAPRHRLDFATTPTPAALRTELATCAAAVVPARWHLSFSRVVAEAQAIGVPVVATAVGGMPEAIVHGVNGFLATPDNPHALAEALLDAVQHDTPAWDAGLVRQQARASAERSRAQLQRLWQLLLSGATEPDLAISLEHGAWLLATAQAHAVSVQAAAQALVATMRSESGSFPPSLPSLDSACEARVFAASRQRAVDLNHAIAFFRACGCRRVATWPSETPADPEMVASLAPWGLQVVACEELPDGILVRPGDATPPAWLRQRFPQARGLVRWTPAGVETLAWGGSAI